MKKSPMPLIALSLAALASACTASAPEDPFARDPEVRLGLPPLLAGPLGNTGWGYRVYAEKGKEADLSPRDNFGTSLEEKGGGEQQLAHAFRYHPAQSGSTSFGLKLVIYDPAKCAALFGKKVGIGAEDLPTGDLCEGGMPPSGLPGFSTPSNYLFISGGDATLGMSSTTGRINPESGATMYRLIYDYRAPLTK